MIDSYRYICAKDSINAKKAAIFAAILMFCGAFIWFIPAWFVAANYPDTGTWGFANLGGRVLDATYLVFVRNEMPAGMVGLMMAAVFAATMSTMDSALNRNAGIFIKNFYSRIMKVEKSEKELLITSKITTLIFGVIIICGGVFMSNLKGTSLFELMMLVATLVKFPILIPSILGFFVKKTPDWAGWGTILVGAVVSYIVGFIITPEMIEGALSLTEPLTRREFGDLRSVTLGVSLHMLITVPFYLFTTLFYRKHEGERKEEIDTFFRNISTEVIAEYDEEDELDNKQRLVLGRLIQVAGLGVGLLCLVPNPFWGRLVFIAVGLIIVGVGTGLVLAIKNTGKKEFVYQ